MLYTHISCSYSNALLLFCAICPGSSVCRYLSTIYVFGACSEAETGALDAQRDHVNLEDNVLQQAVTLDVPSYIFGMVGLLDFYPAGPKRNHQKGKRGSDEREFGTQTIMNSVRGLIAAAYLSYPELSEVNETARTLGVNLPPIDEWRTTFPHWKTFGILDQVPASEGGQFILGLNVPVRKGHLLDQIFVMDEAVGGHRCANRLRWLGESVLEIFVSEFIFNEYSDLDAGSARVLAESMLSDTTLAALCVAQALHTFLRGFDHNIMERINRYVQIVQPARNLELVASDFMDRLASQYWSVLVAPVPQVLASVVQAIAGALAASDDFELDSAKEFFRAFMLPFFNAHYPGGMIGANITTELAGYVVSRGCQQFEWALESAEAFTVHVLFHGNIFHSEEGATASAAAELCATNALLRLKRSPTTMAYLCQCGDVEDA
ncbi:hypothetical protein BOTBODRAFT_69494 [Botryobasidium botryosum FD-172 SS1]|uniref:RNase III domain-containing protein n=1 Tax=Botryobasidium botryosum (strain FD-172 SS1) TaxID=930990 RepID=A0A067MAU5_BOTB1|nr:hypothetical protein BOTBODRAFT_69494 [Botryobasidium botryosum FD-172 SS1]